MKLSKPIAIRLVRLAIVVLVAAGAIGGGERFLLGQASDLFPKSSVDHSPLF